MESQQQATDGAPQYAQRISQAQYEREAVDYTTAMVEQLNADVRAQPALGERSAFFQDPANVAKGLPVFQGKHTRFVYDDDDEAIIAAVDVTDVPLPGPRVRTTAELDSDDDDQEDEDRDEEGDDDEEEEYEEEGAEEDADGDEDMGVANEFYEEVPALDDDAMGALLADVAMELASFDIGALQSQPSRQS